MPRKPNYRFERFERDRAKAAKKAARLKAKQEKAEQKKAEEENSVTGDPGPPEQAPDGGPEHPPSGD